MEVGADTLEADEEEDGREERVLNYWMTTTTSFTALVAMPLTFVVHSRTYE